MNDEALSRDYSFTTLEQCRWPVDLGAMRSPQEVAAARAEFLDVLDERIGRFARGADLSPRYARELHDWLAEQYGDDEQFEPVLAVLRDYRARVGQEEAMTACLRLLRAMHEEFEGPRFPWRGVSDDHEEAWRRAFAEPARGVAVAMPCPICGDPGLRRYFRAYESGRAGGWEWCGNCFSYEHYQATPPAPWQGDDVLDRVPMSVLEHSPEFLERALRLHAHG